MQIRAPRPKRSDVTATAFLSPAQCQENIVVVWLSLYFFPQDPREKPRVQTCLDELEALLKWGTGTPGKVHDLALFLEEEKRDTKLRYDMHQPVSWKLFFQTLICGVIL